MSAAVFQPSRVHLDIGNPLHMHRQGPMSNEASTSSSKANDKSTSSLAPDAQLKTFRRLRSSLEQSVRSATKSKAAKVPSVDESGTIVPKSSKGKDKVFVEPAPKDPKSKSKMFKVSFRRSGGRDTPSPLPPAPLPVPETKSKRSAGFTSYQAPSLRQGSLSSPALHIYSQPFPDPYSEQAEMVSSSSNIAGLVSPARERKRASVQSALSAKEISAPAPLSPRRTSGQSIRESSREPKTPKHRPPPLSSPSTPSLVRPRNGSPLPQTPTTRQRDRPQPPESPTPRSRVQFARSQTGAASSSQLTLNLPTTPRATSPVSPSRARSPSQRNGISSPSPSNILSSTPPRRSLDPPNQHRASLDAHRPSGSQIRPRAGSPPVSPTRNIYPSYSQNRHFNISTTSLSSPPNQEHRELVRTAASILCKELLKPPGHNTTGLGNAELEEVEVRMRALARLERIWGKSGAAASGSNLMLSTAGGLSSSGLSAAGEDREKKLFSEALRDGYVLCQLMNKVRPGSIARVDKREDGFLRTSNVTKFLASCSILGLSSDDLFMRDDIIEGSFDSLARVARTIIAVIQVSENAPPPRGKYLYGKSSQDRNPYSQDSVSRGAVSTPNLSLSQQRSMSPSAPIPIGGRKRWSPNSDLSPVLSGSVLDSETDSDGKTDRDGDGWRGGDGYDQDELPPMFTPPPRSPLRPKPSIDRSLLAESRQSVASSQMTDTTTYSSLLEVQRSSSNQNKFGTIRTVMTDATSVFSSEVPSYTRTEASSVAEELGRKRLSMEKRERKPSETAVVDLSRVAEEAEESGTSPRGKDSTESDKRTRLGIEIPKPQRGPAIRLGKGKWPDDFFDMVTPAPSPSRFLDAEDQSRIGLSESPKGGSALSTSPPRKVAIIGRGNDSAESLPQFPRRPIHRARHSIDAPGLLPKESAYGRDSSPDDRSGFSPPPSRVVLRRNSTQNGAQRSGGVYLPRSSLDETRPGLENGVSGQAPVPFPRAVSGDHSGYPSRISPSEQSAVNFPVSSKQDKPVAAERPHQPRGRFQSEVDGASSRRRPRPNSFDLGANPRRSRFESMVNLGVPTGNTSASDLLSRNSLEGSAVRQTLIVREEGKAATQFQLGNCIGRGQFGAVYRALNLNTGQMVAVKRIGLSGLKEDEISQLMKEVDLLKSLSHPGIVKYEGMARDQDTLSIILEYAENGSLGQTLKAFGKLNERLVASYVVKILEGLHYLHQSDVVHCDLKAANILTTKNGNVKLSDFGVSLNLRAVGREMKDVAGTPNWMAPEVIELKGASPKSDIWSLACTVIELLTGRPPYAEMANGMSVMFRIVEDDMPPLPEGISKPLADFLTQCFDKDPSKRPDADMLCEHEWLKKNWGLHKELRPQDSIPFLRRVSADFHKTTAADATRMLTTLETTPEPEVPARDEFARPDDVRVTPPRRSSNNDPEPISPSEHSFVKTTFGKPVVCRVCLLTVKRSAVLCDQCSLIAHSKCAGNAPPTCNLRAQLLLYAQYAENGTSPIDILGPASPSPHSDGGYTSRTSIDTLSPPSPMPSSPSPHPPTAYKIGSGFRRSHSSLTPEPGSSVPSTHAFPTVNPEKKSEKKVSKKPSVLIKRPGRTISMSTNSTSTGPSMRSTTTESARDATRRSAGTANESVLSEDEENGQARSSRMTGYSLISAATSEQGDVVSDEVPGGMPSELRQRKRDSKSSNGSGCNVQ